MFFPCLSFLPQSQHKQVRLRRSTVNKRLICVRVWIAPERRTLILHIKVCLQVLGSTTCEKSWIKPFFVSKWSCVKSDKLSCPLSQHWLGLKTSSLKMKKCGGVVGGVRKKWTYQTFVAHSSSPLQASGLTLATTVGNVGARFWEGRRTCESQYLWFCCINFDLFLTVPYESDSVIGVQH